MVGLKPWEKAAVVAPLRSIAPKVGILARKPAPQAAAAPSDTMVGPAHLIQRHQAQLKEAEQRQQQQQQVVKDAEEARPSGEERKRAPNGGNRAEGTRLEVESGGPSGQPRPVRPPPPSQTKEPGSGGGDQADALLSRLKTELPPVSCLTAANLPECMSPRWPCLSLCSQSA